MHLAQEIYEDDNGRPVKAESLSAIGTFKYKTDGFFSWTCGKCNEDHSCRAHKINGVVFKCEKCFAQCLLLRSDCECVNKMNADAGAEIRRLVEEEKDRFIEMWSQKFNEKVSDKDLLEKYSLLIQHNNSDWIYKKLYDVEIKRRMKNKESEYKTV